MRPPWESLPDEVRSAVVGLLGAPVVAARSASGGSPGVAALVTTADGRSAFVKATSRQVNPRTPDLHAREAEVMPLVTGQALLHLEARSDNLLVRPDGAVVLVDWPHATRGAPLIDLVAFAPSVAGRRSGAGGAAGPIPEPVAAAAPAGDARRTRVPAGAGRRPVDLGPRPAVGGSNC